MKPTTLGIEYIAGLQFGDYKEAALVDGDELYLIPEPDNKYNDKAILIVYKARRLGYIKRSKDGIGLQSLIHAKLTAGATLKCRVLQHDLHSKNLWTRIKIIVEEVVEGEEKSSKDYRIEGEGSIMDRNY